MNQAPVMDAVLGEIAVYSIYCVCTFNVHYYGVQESREFDWDEHNEQHLAKHGISRSDAEDVLSGNHVLLEYQTEGDEERWVAVGATRAGRILSVVFAVRNDAVRPITGWVADKETADLYVRQWGSE